jgi:hypothetical protein
VTFAPDSSCHWVWKIAERSPEVALRRLVEHDALHLHEAIQPRLRARFLLLDAERVFQRTCARVAYSAATGEPPAAEQLSSWFQARIDEAARDCLAADERALADGRAVAEDPEHYLQFLWNFLVPPEHLLFASVQFHGLPEHTRRCFFALLMEQCSVSECLARGLGPEEQLRKEVLRALEAATTIAPAPPAELKREANRVGPWWVEL